MTARILVTGGGGQVATALKQINSGLDYEFYSRGELDVSSSAAIVGCFKHKLPQLVINTAAYTAVDDAEIYPETADRVNRFGVKVLASACKKFKVPLIQLSTDYVFDGASKTPYLVNSRTHPLSIYGQTKRRGEEVLKKYLNDYAILRLSGVFSDHANCFPLSILTAALNRTELKVVNDQFTGPTSVHSIGIILDLMAQRVLAGNLNWGIYHFAQQPFLSWYDFAQMIITKARDQDSRYSAVKVIPITTEECDAKAPRPKYACLESEKLLSELRVDHSILSRDLDLDNVIYSIICKL